MAPFFTFFVDKDESVRCAPYIKKLDSYYPSFADGVYITPAQMKKRYAGANARFFAFDFQDLIMFELDIVNEIEPLLVLTVDKTTRMNNESWITVYKFLKAVFADEYIDLVEIHKIVPPISKLEEKIQLIKEVTLPIEQNKEYGFEYIVEGDVAYCQITKPYTDLPYTAVIREFEKNGLEQMFTALYVSSSWGVCSHDHAFLNRLWKYLNMPGELDLEKRLALEIQKCKEGKPEPELYRLNIMGVKEQLSNKQKRREISNLDPSKFIKL